MNNSSTTTLKEHIVDYGAISYVPISSKDGFFLIKLPGILLESFEPLGKIVHSFELSMQGPGLVDIPQKSCVIFHKGKTSERGVNEDVESYLSKYESQIFDSPEFALSNYFYCRYKTVPLKEVWGYKGDLEDVADVPVSALDCLVWKEGIKISSPKYFKPICDLLRQIGLLNEARGGAGRTKKNDFQKERDELIIQFYNDSKIKKPLPIEKIQEKLIKTYVKNYSNDTKRHKPYHPHDHTIRRILTNYIKSSSK